ncbi:hypothetical protein SJAV_21220 [Sulfurisphaera javensis]|uniref:Uncharacterized protein n=1 Tax=Sulfurisphaera javensis TaxID=2049879 RepID=A0AAT9GTI7_9CREN
MITEVYKSLLISENKYDRLDAWFKVDYLVNVLGINEVKSKINFFISLLCDKDLDIVLHAWQLLPKLLKLGLVQRSEADDKCFVKALREGDINAWWIGIDLYKEGVIDLSLLKNEIESYKKALSSDPLTRLGAWSLLPEMLKLDLVKDIDEKLIVDLLKDKSLNYHIKLNVLYLVLELKEKGIIKNLDIQAVKEIVNNPMFKQLSEAYDKDWKKVIQVLS